MHVANYVRADHNNVKLAVAAPGNEGWVFIQYFFALMVLYEPNNTTVAIYEQNNTSITAIAIFQCIRP